MGTNIDAKISGQGARRHAMGWSDFGDVFSHSFLSTKVLKRTVFKIYFEVRKGGFRPPQALILSLKITIS